MTFISDKNPVPDEVVPSFDRFETRTVLKVEPGRLAYAPGVEYRELAIELAVDWLKSDPTTDAARLFTAADMIAHYIRTGAHPVDPQE